MVIFMSEKAIIAMSGGVDSSVAAYLVKSAGYETAGITLKLFDNYDIGIEKEKTCCSLEDVEDARKVAFQLGMPYYVFNFADEFKKEVMEKFARTYISGATPNPCIDCNRFIKFEKLIERAQQLEYGYVATGHYSIIEHDKSSGRYLLKKGIDDSKDQSYVLYALTQEQLSKTLFPLGEFKKEKIREIASELGFVNARKKDSQDICFVKDGNYKKFIEDFSSCHFEDGNFVDVNGNILGSHKGIVGYTIGQRRGLGISSVEPYYVVNKDIPSNSVILGRETDLYSKRLIAGDVNFIAINSLKSPMKVKARVRYKQKETPAILYPSKNGEVIVEFEQPQRAVTKGQAVVFYDDNYVVGGGTIQ